MATRIRTLNFLPEIFKTTTNTQFLKATLDQLVAQPNLEKIEGYVGSKFGYGINAKDKYVTEPTKVRTDYQLDPGVIFLKSNTDTAQDFISYPGIIDALSVEGAKTADNSRLFSSQFYSWDSFTDLDKIINFNQYYWLPSGPEQVEVATDTVFSAANYIVLSEANGYNVSVNGEAGVINPTLTLLRGGTYTFQVNQTSQFWIQGAPGVTGYDPLQHNVQTREVLGVTNNGETSGTVTFTVPNKDAQNEYNFPGNNFVDLISTLPFDQIEGAVLNTLGGIDGITSLNGLTVMFYDGLDNESGFISEYFDESTYDQDNPLLPNNFGDFEGGYYTNVSATFYTISYIGDPSNPILKLTDTGVIPTNEKITVRFGNEWISKTFYRNPAGVINVVPYLSAILDTLYYQDGTSSNKVGVIKLINSNTTNTIDVITDILGQKNYTATNGVVFTNGLKVVFSGDIVPSSYKTGQYYVEGVGSGIELILVEDLIAPELALADTGSYIPYDTTPYDIGNYDSSLYVPNDADYITIARNAINKNAWSRSNRWFHSDVINATAVYNNDPNLVSVYATALNKAKRPIIEFYPNLRLFDSGVVGKKPIDFIDFRTTDALSLVAGQENYYPDVEVYTAYTGSITAVTVPALSTTINIAASDVTGSFAVGQYITDSTNLLPTNAYISSITGTTTLTLTVTWSNLSVFPATSTASLVATDTTNDNYALFDGSRVVFAADTQADVKNKIFVARFSNITGSLTPIITLTEAEDGLVLADEQTVAFRGYNYSGKDFYFDGFDWLAAQQKITVNQAPLFDVFDDNGISFSNPAFYLGTSFAGNKLFSYGLGSGLDDTILGFPLQYSSIVNVGDISFDVSLNKDTFNYVSGSTPITQKVNTGYVHNYTSPTNVVRQLGWQTAVSPSVQYQIFDFEYLAATPTTTFTCDVAMNSTSSTNWPTIQVFVNNVIQETYTVTVGTTTTTVEFTVPNSAIDTIIQILVLSDQVSKTAYYSIPTNLNNNPLNSDITTVNVGDIRGQYQSMFYNSPNTTGPVFGSNNFRDLGNLVPYGNKIIQNSASLVLPGTFLRKQDHNLFNALMFNSREYITYKTLLVDTVNATDYSVYQTPAVMLDSALDQITASKTDSNSFFWSDMLPSKSAYISNTYSFANSLDVSIYPLSRVYDFTKANYYGVLVYLTRTSGGVTKTSQLTKGTDYTVSTDAPTLTITTDLLPGDTILINEFNQTYGSYVPNTPTKLGLYPSTIPAVILDDSYSQPTYFIVGHDGSYNKLYGDYNPTTGKLVDFRDQVLLEFEQRIYNNLKVSAVIPIQAYEVLPGFFRNTDYSYDEVLAIYSTSFLNWVGQNRVDYKKQFYSDNNEFTYNYYQSGNKINKAEITQGYWRGVYEYFYDTSTPESTPWEMLGFTDQPTWWTARYGAAPYTSDNLVLWGDLAAGIDWNNGNPVVIPQAIREELLQVLPVDSQGNLVSPFVSIVGNYTGTTFNRDWKVGDLGPAEFSYRKSSSWPFDLMRILALTKPAEFFNLAVDVDNYKYSTEFNQYLVSNRSHLIINDVEIYGSGTAKTSYINWIVDFEKQVGVDATQNITTLLDNLDVRLVYRLAGFSDKDMLKFYVEKGTPNSRNASLLIPDESYSVLLYDNQPFTKIVYSGVIVQITSQGYAVYGNSQTNAYFTTLKPKINGNYDNLNVEKLTVQVANDYDDVEIIVPYGASFSSVQEVSQFLESYGKYLETQGLVFDQIENGIEVTWRQMGAEFLYWAQMGWEVGSITNINPAATLLTINKDSHIVQPLTLQQQNFILNQNLYPIQGSSLSVLRDGTLFTAQPMNQGDTIAYGTFNISNFEHGIVFNNITLFDDIIYNLTTGLRQNRIVVRGTKTAEWNGTVDAQGFILNQDNIQDWSKEVKYTTGSIVKYKNKYWIATKIIQAKELFDERDWKVTAYDQIQKGLLPNSSTRSYESTLYYDVNQANLENDADLLSFSLIGYRPRDYMALADLTDITQVNVYKNLIKNKGTLNAASAFKGATLVQGGIDYDIYENWAIKSGEFGGVLNSNFIDVKLNQTELTGNPSIIGMTNGLTSVDGVQQEIPLYSIFNYGRPITNPNVLPEIASNTPSTLFPDAGYVNFDDVKMSSYYYFGLSSARSSTGTAIPLSQFYVRDYTWIANQFGTWTVLTPTSLGQVVNAKNNLNDTVTITFATPHNLTKYQAFGIVNFNVGINGYYIANAIVDPYRVVISLTLAPTITTITGFGIGLGFQSQRVAKPSDIINLPLLDSEFIKNKVWVDENTNGDWAVYRKSINYGFDRAVTKTASSTFGSAVAFTSDLGYLVGDAGLGEVYRYRINDLTGNYDLVQTIAHSTSFGTTISYSDSCFVISQPTGTLYTDRKIYVYEYINTTLQNNLQLTQTIVAPDSSVTSWGSATALSGDKNWLYVSDITNNTVYVYRKSQITGLYELSNTIDADSLALTVAGDNFGYALSTDYYGETLVVSAPNKDFSITIDNWGYTYVFDRTVQNLEAQYTSLSYVPQTFPLAWTPTIITTTATATVAATDRITCTSTSGFVADMPVIFSGTILLNSGLAANKVYYIKTVVSPTQFTVSTTRGGTVLDLAVSSGSMTVTVQSIPRYVSVNGTLLDDNQYAVIGTVLYMIANVNAGDIITVSSSHFILAQTLTTETTPRVGVQFGHSLDTTQYTSEILVGAPFELGTQNHEGAVYRFTNGGGKYGAIVGTSTCTISTPETILLNGYAVTLPIGNATTAAATINSVNITNVFASAVDGKLVIQLINVDLATPNDKLRLAVLSSTTLAALGLTIFTQTQVINCPHLAGATQFGSTVKFNESDSVVVSAPVGTRFSATTFDFTDDEILDNDTLFDNNTTQWVDTFANAGAVYMFDYLGTYEESLANIGKFTYAQSVNATDLDYGSQPMYGQALDFNNSRVVVGTPNFKPSFTNGQVVSYSNSIGSPDWSVYRSSSPVVDTARIQNILLYSALTNNTLDNLDYIDPLQGKILGSVRENIDVVSNQDPASYNSVSGYTGSLAWGTSQLGQLWFNTSNVRFVNYHQNDVVYNSKYWGTVFPGSDIAIYSWISSSVLPSQYTGPGTVFDVNSYSVEYAVNAVGALTPLYFFWARNTNTVFTNTGKTLSDSVIQSYIASPISSGISYFAPLQPDVFALYNCGDNINATDTVLNIGFATGTNDDVAHNLFSLIRANYADDFLPGLPGTGSINVPESLYDRMLDSLCGVDESGGVVPNPYLPKPVQNGVLARPRQSFFVNRFNALKNYLTYANEILAQYPIVETRRAAFLSIAGTSFDTSAYWSYVNWWAVGYNDNTKSALQVPLYADLSTITASLGLIVTVTANSDGKSETYIYTSADVWERIGLQDGTIEFSSVLWDYQTARLGFGDNFFDTTVFDEYPSAETRYIVRALNEEIYTNELLIHRNKSLILLFEFIQSETIESQNYLPWLNKTSFIDVAHTIRELVPLEVFQSDNQNFLAGYLNEVKPYHVVIKDFLFKYTRTNVYEGNITDFDLPAQFDPVIEQFITPELVYANPSENNQFIASDPIWQTAAYSEWYANYGVSITGVNDFLITTLASYIALNSDSFAVDNAFGLPINGVLKIGTELIGYSSVDRSLSIVSGLTRGVNGTVTEIHLPGENIYIDLPAVLLLNGGRAYSEPPKVVAYIDTNVYPTPTREAVLSVTMNADRILSINVIDAGAGYAVLPEIIIAPSIEILFNSANVNVATSVIELPNPLLETGDLIKYEIGEDTTAIGGLVANQYYYVNVLQIVPTFVVALYSNYADSLDDTARIRLVDSGTGNNHYLNLSARASCVTSAAPIRENQLTLRFDRTSYDSKITDWVADKYYGSFYAGLFNNSESISSSSITLENVQPPISSILASAQGAAFEIESISRNEVITWSSRTRNAVQTYSSTFATVAYRNSIKLTPSDGGTPVAGNLGTTTGFYVGMPVKFVGAAFGGLTSDITYYVKTVVDSERFTVSATITAGVPGATVTLSNGTASVAGLICYVGEVQYSTIIAINYPGILATTATTAVTNHVTVPLTASGQGGTTGFYVGLPIYFTGNVLVGGEFVIGNTYTILTVGTTDFISCGASENKEGTVFVATNTGSGTGTVSTVFGNVIANEPYFITTIIDNQTFTMSSSATPTIINVTATATGTNIITCESTLSLSVNDPVIFNGMTISGVAASSFGNLVDGVTYYVSLLQPNTTQFSVSELINGANFALSTQVAGTGTGCVFTEQKDTIALTSSTGSMTCTVGLPVSPGQITGQEFTFYPTSAYYTGITGTDTTLMTRKITSALAASDYFSVTSTSGGIDNFYVGMPIKVDANFGSLIAGTTYNVASFGTLSAEVTNTSSSGNLLTCLDTTGFYVHMPIVFSGTVLGGIELGITYYIKSVPSSTTFTVSLTDGGSTFVLQNDNGTMSASGEPFMTLTGVNVLVNAYSTTVNMTQTPTVAPIFSVSYILGGYRIAITNPGAGYAVNNVITILGTSLGGTTPANDLTLTVNTINSTGQITSAIRSGDPAETVEKYYLKTISASECEVFSDSLLTIPVNGNTFVYSGVSSTTATATDSGTGRITVGSSSSFELNDPVVFTGNVFGNLVLGTQYYVIGLPTTTTIIVSETVGGSAFAISTDSGLMTVAKPGDFAFLPEPFYFDQSIVRYNHRVYQCIVSNNDNEFIFGKWELLTSGDRKLNALDRIVGYYEPTINMPGLDLTQLVSGITYPNSTYLGNAFAPDDEFTLDTILKDTPFYPTGINTESIVWNGTSYIAMSNAPDFSASVVSTDAINWVINKISNEPIAISDLVYTGSKYVVTSQNLATPILTSADGVVWSADSLEIIPTGLNSIAYLNGIFVAVGEDIITSTNASVWNKTYDFNTPYVNNLVNVSAVNVPSFYGFIAVGSTQEMVGQNLVTVSAMLLSVDGYIWNKLSTALANYSLNAVAYSGTTIVVVGDNGVRFVSSNASNWVAGTAPSTSNINDAIYANSLFVAIGDGGAIQTSTDGLSWVIRTSGTTSKLNGIVWNSTSSMFVVVGDDNTVLTSSNGTVWTVTGEFSYDVPITYNVQGDAFTAGYGPEELVPGVVTDNLTMTIATRPGTNWPAVEYQHVGYNVISLELSPTSGTQVEYSFAGAVQTPAKLAIFIIDGTTGVSTSVYQPAYTINWINQTVTLVSPIALTSTVRIDVYEVGNGDQLAKASSLSDPIRINPISGYNEIYLNCNYSSARFTGSGVVRPGTSPIEVNATATFSSDNTIQCDNVTSFLLNNPITFQGTTFGNIVEGDIYYVKTISPSTNKITVSSSVSAEHVAGPAFTLINDTGSMVTIIQVGTGAPWTDPIVYHNGTKLILGEILSVTATVESNNTVVCNTTTTLAVDDRIAFSDTMFGGVLIPQTIYYVQSIVSSTAFRVSATIGGPAISLTDYSGSARVINNDYAFGIADNGVSASLVFTDQYDDTVDYLTYTVFGETEPAQYGYTIPETQLIVTDGVNSVFDLTNYVGGANPDSAVVELDGVRLTNISDYVINEATNQITMSSVLTIGKTIAITSYNLTSRQYFHTEYGITGNTVSSIVNISNTISSPLATPLVTATTSGTNLITCASNSGFVVGQTILFKGTSFGTINTSGLVYFVKTIVGLTQFTIADETGTVIPVTTGTGAMVAYVGGNPAIRVTTDIANNLAENDIVRIDGTLGSVQLNNNTYYAKIISSVQFDLYSAPYNPAYAVSNYPITSITSYTSGGYAWLDTTFTLVTTACSATTSGSNEITATSTSELVIDTPIIFTGTTFGGIVEGTTYFVREVTTTTKFTISETQFGEEFVLSSDSGTMNATEWEQYNVDRLWVTINGYRVPSSSLRLNPDNNLSILAEITTSDKVIITSMMPSATPNELVYIQNVNKNGDGSVYRANTLTRTWLVAPLVKTDTTIYLRDITRVTNLVVQNVTAPAAVSGVYSIGVTADKNMISQVIVRNNTTGTTLPTTSYYIQVENLSPVLKITAGVTVGQSLTISILEGNLIYLNGEQIKFSTANLSNNTLSGLQRGTNGTGMQSYMPLYSEVYGLLSGNRLPQVQYNQTWNSYDFNATEGDPLQISNTVAAEFLAVDIS